MTPDQEKLAAHMLDALETPYPELTKWEEGFVESVREQFNTRHWLSDLQMETLERVYTEKTR